ncbi:MAG: protein adenylyltransferase SelO family protein, partial [Methylomonas sp.]
AEHLQQALANFQTDFEQGWRQMQADKLGLLTFIADSDDQLLTDLLKLLLMAETDMTLFYRGLADLDPNLADSEFFSFLEQNSYKELSENCKQSASGWLQAYQARIRQDGRGLQERRAAMNSVNPCYVLRNYLAQQAIDLAEQGDYSGVNELLAVLRHPYTEQPDKSHFAAKRPDWAKHRPGCSMLSCSS